MEFRLTEEQEGVRRLVRDVVEKEVKPLAAHTDETGEFPWGPLQTMARLGLLGLNGRTLLQAANRSPSVKPRAKSVIFLFQWGGPSHIDMFDMKPKAPDGVRGPYRPIAISAPGIEVGELLPETAQHSNDPSRAQALVEDQARLVGPDGAALAAKAAARIHQHADLKTRGAALAP